MNADIYADAIQYELLTQAIYQDLLAREGDRSVEVKHNVSRPGRSGVEHQIDVYWEYRKAGIAHRVLIECKNYATNITLEKVRNFFAVVHDIGNCVGIMVTKTGYQSGAAAFCKHYGLLLKLVRKPTDADWEGRIKTIVINMTPRIPVSNDEHPIACSMYMQPSSDEQEGRLQAAIGRNASVSHADPFSTFLDNDGQPNTEELRFWIPRQLDVLSCEDGGPYKKSVRLDEHYVAADLGSGPELIKVIGVVIEFWVETLQSQQVIVDATLAVDAILKDYHSGEWEHAHRSQ